MILRFGKSVKHENVVFLVPYMSILSNRSYASKITTLSLCNPIFLVYKPYIFCSINKINPEMTYFQEREGTEREIMRL